MYLNQEDIDQLACPKCHGRLEYDGRSREKHLIRGVLRCADGPHTWRVREGIARLVDERTVRGSDGMLRPFYDLIAPLHDVAADLVLPVLQYPEVGTPEIRRKCVDALELATIAGDAPHRVLEVGIGSGANLPFVDRGLADATSEIWGVDLSEGMLRECRRRIVASPPRHRVRLVLSDGHSLPFPDATFDRVLHVGGINGFRDRRTALREVARVTRPGGVVVVVDEELSPTGRHSPVHRMLFSALTLLEASPRAPRADVPSEVTDVETWPVSRFYYGLRFRIPGGAVQTATTRTKTSMATPNEIAGVLSSDVIARFQDAYAEATAEKVNAMLSKFFLDNYPMSREYLEVLEKGFYGDTPSDVDRSGTRTRLSAADRERCLLAILASRGSGLNLSVHVYLAIMEGVTPSEVAHILFLAGAYSGIPAFADSLKVAVAALKLMADMYTSGGDITPPTVLAAFGKTFNE